MKDKTKIPHGYYCYSYENDERIICPYWGLASDGESQNNGYCDYLKKGDWDWEELSLLWDQVKECGENMDSTEYKNGEDGPNTYEWNIGIAP